MKVATCCSLCGAVQLTASHQVTEVRKTPAVEDESVNLHVQNHTACHVQGFSMLQTKHVPGLLNLSDSAVCELIKLFMQT